MRDGEERKLRAEAGLNAALSLRVEAARRFVEQHAAASFVGARLARKAPLIRNATDELSTFRSRLY